MGDLTPEELARPARNGVLLGENIRRIGGDPARLAEARHEKGSVAAYLELHIEQGGTLDAAGVPIGVVEGIVGIHHYEVTLRGFANHAGTTPMDARRNALLAASEVDPGRGPHRALRARTAGGHRRPPAPSARAHPT